MKTRLRLVVSLAAVMLAVSAVQWGLSAQAPPGRGGRGGAPPPDPTRPARVELIEGTVARYKVREQLAGISFPSDAVGTTTAVTGGLVLNPDGSVDAKQSRIVVDLKGLTSDQAMRDGYVQRNTLQTEKFPTLEFVPTRTVGLSMPLPSAPPAQAGFQLVGDMTLHGVTREVTWNVVATFGNDAIAGRATTTLTFEMFKIAKPSLARLLSVDDEIVLEIEFRGRRTAL
jgi:polyisoprenoid-binding protein YceI